MKKVALSVLFFITVSVITAQTEVQPLTTTEQTGGTHTWVKVLVSVAAIAIMSLIFYLAKNFKKK